MVQNDERSDTVSDYNYSVDYMKKAAFFDEVNNVLIHRENTVEKDIIVEYLKNRIEEITKKYK
jgi:hypothetical protein